MESKKNKIKEAAALRYLPEKGGAPEIVALGKGDTAERIIAKARENDVPLYEDANLAHTLNYLKIGNEIPPELYDVVAQVLVFVSRLDGGYDLSDINTDKIKNASNDVKASNTGGRHE